jgi:hypothetical protein
MAYNYGFPATYQPMYQPFSYTPVQPPQQNVAPVQPSVQVPVQQQAQQSSIIWVQGEAGAKSYLVAPNNTVQLWDSEQQTIYLKSADGSGMPSMKILDYTIRETDKNPPNTVSNLTDDKIPVFATKDEIKAVSEQITALRDRVDNLTRKRRREDEDE